MYVCMYVTMYNETIHGHKFYFARITWHINMYNILNMEILIIGLVFVLKSIFLF